MDRLAKVRIFRRSDRILTAKNSKPDKRIPCIKNSFEWLKC
jgi:hypothetical protein